MKASVISRSETWFFLSAYWREEGRWGFWLNLQNNYCDEIWSLIFTKNMKILLEILCAFSFLILWFSSKEKLECFGPFWFYANSTLAVRITYMGTILFFLCRTFSPIAVIMPLMWHHWVPGDRCTRTALVSRYKLALVYIHFCYLDAFCFQLSILLFLWI